MSRDVTVTFEDGSTHVYQGVPDEATPEQVTARASQEFGKNITALDGGRGAIPSSGPGESRRGKYITQAERQMRQEIADPYTYDPESGARVPLSTLNARLDASVAVPEAALSMASGMVAAPSAGIAGVVSAPFVGGKRAADIVRNTQEAMTYQPRTKGGQQVTAVASYPFEKLAQVGDWAGRNVADATYPALGAMTNAAIQSIPALLARGTVRNGRSSPNRIDPRLAAGEVEAAPKPAPQAGRNAGLEGIPEKPQAPSIEELQDAKNKAYKAAEHTGVVVSRKAINRLKVGLVNDLKKEGLNRKLHPKAVAALEEIVNKKGQLSLTEIETLRKIANDAKGALEPSDARLGAKIVEHIDDFEEGLSASDVVGGDASAATAFKEARALNTRLAKAKTIQKLFSDAELQAGANYTMSGMENALRQQFKALAKNDKRMRGFSAEEKAAIRKVALGGPLENTLRMIGKFAPSGTVPSLVGLGAVAYGGPAGFMIPAAGAAGRYAATRLTMRNANAVSDLVRRGPQRNTLLEQSRNSLAETQ